MIGAVVGSYVLGSITVPLGAVIDTMVPGWRRTPDDARRDFLASVPEARDRAFVSADPPLLLAAAELHDKPVAGEVTRMEALSMMLRNIALSLAAASIAAVVELAAGPNRLLAAGCAVLLLAAVVSTVRQARTARHYARLKPWRSASGSPTSTPSSPRLTVTSSPSWAAPRLGCANPACAGRLRTSARMKNSQQLWIAGPA